MWSKSKEIMGINARNLLYVSRYNSRANKKFADDKIFTKNYLKSRDIDVARLYQAVRSHTELNNFNTEILPNSFVIKPNKGYGGQGILVIIDKKKDKYIGIDGEKYDWDDLYRHCESILEGKYSISGLSDQVIFEEFLVRHKYLDNFTTIGLPDIRVIVFNLVPVMAMLRIPTEKSKGKANLHLGAIGVGIDMGSGRATYGVTQKSIYRNEILKKFPNEESISSLVIPEWNKILLTASKAQQISKIGYLAIDIALTQTGIKVLELNARAGLSVQIANLATLRTRLNKVADLKVITPEKGVEISKTLFTKSEILTSKTNIASLKTIIAPFEEVEILNTKYKSVWAKIDPHAKNNIISKDLDIDNSAKIFKIKLANKRLTIPFSVDKIKESGYQMILSGKYLTDFLVDSQLIRYKENDSNQIKEKEQKILNNVDKIICQIDESIKLLSYFRPLNLEEEKKIFFEHGDYNPKFTYRKVDLDFKLLRKNLKKIPTDFNHPLLEIYKKKIQEVEYKIALLENINKPDLQKYSEKIYGKVDQELYDQAVEYFKKNPVVADKSKKISFKAGLAQIEEFLKKHKLHNWKINVVDGLNTDMQVTKSGLIIVKNKAEFTADKLSGLIAHEIQTHIFRAENGKLQDKDIFARGTADYLKTEEGLAVYNKNLATGGSRQGWAALNVIAIFLGKQMGFADLFHYLMEHFFIDQEVAWKFCVKVKRGYVDTSQKYVFAKDQVYFSGILMIDKFVKEHGKKALKDLYIGKISIDDLDYLEDVDQYSVRHLPEFYHGA